MGTSNKEVEKVPLFSLPGKKITFPSCLLADVFDFGRT